VSITLCDSYGRRIEYLRISVTDRCNFRCLYCMPVAGLQWLPKSDILSYEEIAQIVRELAPLGLRRLRITGGEPTLRPDLNLLIEMLSSIRGIEDLSLSTNGVRLAELADSLKAAGLDRVNMSADSLRPDRIRSISRRNLAFDPITAATAAENAGLSPIKINVVVMRGINDDEISDFARLTVEIHRADAGRRDARPHMGPRSSRRGSFAPPRNNSFVGTHTRTPSGKRTCPIFSVQWRAWNGWSDHSDVAHLLRFVQSRETHSRRAAAHLSVR